MSIYISRNEQDTIRFAKDFAKKLKRGNIIVLSGELGSGKTKFVQGVLEYFGLAEEISSPTFTIVNEYIKDDVNIYHFCYRHKNTLGVGGSSQSVKSLPCKHENLSLNPRVQVFEPSLVL